MSMGWRMDNATMGVTALSVGNAASLMTVFNPDMFTIRSAQMTQNVDAAPAVHLGMALGAGISVVIAFGGSLVTQSWWPLFGTIVGLAIMCWAYEWALRNPHGAKVGDNG